MKIALNSEVKELDRVTIEEIGIQRLLLMENAGYAVTNEIISIFGEGYFNKKVCVFAGKGNNGGDAFVVARHLINSGIKTKIFLLNEVKDLAPDTLTNFNILQNMQADITIIKNEKTWDKVLVSLMLTDLIVDGLLGTGFDGKKLDENLEKAITMINESNKFVLAIDIPSGVNGDNGCIAQTAVQANQTVTLALPKVGLFLPQGKEHTRKLTVVPIGIPSNVFEKVNIQQSIVSLEMVASLLPIRSTYAHKNEAKTAVVAGAVGTSGAAALCSEAALRIGAGVVKLFAPKSIADLMALKLTEVMVEEMPEEVGVGLKVEFVKSLLDKTNKFDVLAMGPGLGTELGTSDTVCQIIEKTDRKLVLDADALNVLAGKTEMLTRTKEVAVVTPHLGEMAKLTGLTVEQIKNEGILNIARKYAKEWRAVVVLKGAPTIIAFPNDEIFINTTGNQGMATAGSGDVLAGCIAGLLAQGIDQGSAAICGVYLHGLAGDIIAHDGMIGIAAGDISSALPKAWGSIVR